MNAETFSRVISYSTHWLGQVRESNRNLERQNEALAAQGMRARTALKDVEANRVNYAVGIIPCMLTETAPFYHCKSPGRTAGGGNAAE